MQTPGRTARWVGAILLGGVLLPGAGWVAARAAYHSWHPCDWLLQDEVEAALLRRGIDPGTAGVPALARAAGLPEVRAALEARNTPAACLSTWASGRVLRRP